MQNRLKLELYFEKKIKGKIIAKLLRMGSFELARFTVNLRSSDGRRRLIKFPFSAQTPIPVKSILIVESHLKSM